MSVKILSVERTAVADELLVRGEVDGEVVTVSVWESALYGEAPDPDAKDADGRHERAPKLGGADGAPEHDEVDAGPRAVKVPTTDKQRQAYLRERLLEAAPAEPDTLDHLAD